MLGMHLPKEITTEEDSDGITHSLTGVDTIHKTPLNPLENINTTLATINPTTDRMTQKVTILKADSEVDRHAGECSPTAGRLEIIRGRTKPDKELKKP